MAFSRPPDPLKVGSPKARRGAACVLFDLSIVDYYKPTDRQTYSVGIVHHRLRQSLLWQRPARPVSYRAVGPQLAHVISILTL